MYNVNDVVAATSFTRGFVKAVVTKMSESGKRGFIKQEGDEEEKQFDPRSGRIGNKSQWVVGPWEGGHEETAKAFRAEVIPHLIYIRIQTAVPHLYISDLRAIHAIIDARLGKK